MKYYLAPKSWSRDSYRDVLTEGEVAALLDEETWNASAADCIALGDFENPQAAWEAARGIDPDNVNPVKPE